MENYQPKPRTQRTLLAMQTPEVTRFLTRMRRLYPKARPLEEVRAMMAEALGDRSLTDELYRMRGCDG